MKYGYARVSTVGQMAHGNSLEAQEEELKKAGAEEIVSDSWTGKTMDRPGLQKLLGRLQPGDEIIVTKLDRFARTVGQASDLITDLIDRGVVVNVLNIGRLSNDATSTLLRNVLLAFGQFEREMIVERTQEGRAVARTKPGYREGRHRKYSVAKMDHAMELLKDHSYSQVASLTGISTATLAREKRRRKEA